MAGLFRGKSVASNVPRYTSLNLQTSAQGLCIPLVYGKVRTTTNLIWYGDFRSTAQRQKAGKGGGGGSVTSYTYATAVMMALCEGDQVTAVDRVWASKSVVSLASLGLTLFTGGLNQAPWGYMTATHPSEALSYSGTAYVAASAYQLGSSPDLPQHGFEVVGTFSGSNVYAGVDANPRYILYDYLTNERYGLGFPTDGFGAGALDLWENYCQAQGLFMSVYLNEQEQANSTLQRWAQLTNSWITWTGTRLRIIPLGTEEITANGVTYTPDNTPVYDLGYDDFLSKEGEQPVRVTRSDTADGYNQVQLDVLDRSNAYNNTQINWEDAASIEQNGKLQSQIVQAHEFTVPAIGQKVASLIGKRATYIRNTYDFQLSPVYILLETGDIVTLTDEYLGLDRFPVRIVKIEEDEEYNLSVTAEEFPAGIGEAADYTAPAWEGSATPDTLVDPGDVNTPGIIEPNATATQGDAQVWLALSGGEWWGGAQIYISFDGGTTYSQIGSVVSPSIQGVLTANLPVGTSPDTVNTLSIDTTISRGELPSTSVHSDADTLRTLTLVGDELLAYGEVVPGVGAYEYDLDYLVRGAYGTTIGSHLTGALFSRMDPNTIFTYDLPEEYVGATLYFKFVSFNVFGLNYQDLSDVTAYPYTPTGLAFYIAPPTALSFAPSSVTQDDGTTILSMDLSWTASLGPLLGSYEIQYSIDSGATWFADATVGSGAVSRALTPALPLTDYRARIRAITQNGSVQSTWAVTADVNSGPLVTTVPAMPTGVVATPGPATVDLSWTVAADPTILFYKIFRASGLSQPFGSAVLVQSISASSWQDTTVLPSAGYTYWVVAHNAAGDSPEGPTVGVDVTTLALGAGQPYDIPMSFIGMPESQMVFYRLVATHSFELPIGLVGSEAVCQTAPTDSSCVIFVLKNGVSVGSVTWAIAATTATFQFLSAESFVAGDVLALQFETVTDSTFSDPSITLSATR